LPAQAPGTRPQPAAAAAWRSRTGVARPGRHPRTPVCRSRRPDAGYRRPVAGSGDLHPRPLAVHPLAAQRACGMSAAARIVEVAGEHAYRIGIGPGALADGAALASLVRGRHVLLVSDSTVAPLYASAVREALHGARPDLLVATFVLPAGEASKT